MNTSYRLLKCVQIMAFSEAKYSADLPGKPELATTSHISGKTKIKALL